jgi:hypothetical protein
MRNVSAGVLENIKTHILIYYFYFSKKCAINERMWNNIVELGRQQIVIWHMPISCWIPNLQTQNQNM